MSKLRTKENEIDFEEDVDQYNDEIELANAEIEAGNYLPHDEVVIFFQTRRNAKL